MSSENDEIKVEFRKVASPANLSRESDVQVAQSPPEQKAMPVGDSERSEAETIRWLKSLDTHFVFFFGKYKSGKSVILASLLRSLRHGGGKGEFHPNIEKPFDRGAVLVSDLEGYMDDNRFPPRTKQGNVICVNGEFTPNDQRFADLDITFLEMSGEDLTEVAIQHDSVGSLPSHIDVYLKADGLPIVFILVSPWMEAAQDDKVIAQFLDYVKAASPKGHSANSRMFLLITQWDTYKGQATALEFAKANMKKTYNAIRSFRNIVNEYSVGRVVAVDKQPYIDPFNDEYPSRLWNQIYMTFTGRDLMKKSFFQWLFGK